MSQLQNCMDWNRKAYDRAQQRLAQAQLGRNLTAMAEHARDAARFNRNMVELNRQIISLAREQR